MHNRITALRKVWEDAADAPPVLRMVLKPPAALYGMWMRTRAILYRKGVCRSNRLPCHVISVGNLSVGGTGKTPMVLYLARYLTGRGRKVAVVSRGYRGRFESGGGIVSDGKTILAGAADSGDEPQVLARLLRGVPVIVGGNRFRAGQRAVSEFAPDVILLDDAFQHLKLQRDLDIVLLNCSRPFGNGYTLPAGELREPPQALKRGDAVILTRCRTATGCPAAKTVGRELAVHTRGPVFRTRHVTVVRRILSAEGDPRPDNTLAGRRVFAFSGVAKNDEFLYTLSGLDCKVAGSMGFPDHHDYTAADLAGVCRQAEKNDVDYIVTTEKDFVKLEPAGRWPVDLAVLGVDISFGDDRERFHAFVDEQINISTD